MNEWLSVFATLLVVILFSGGNGIFPTSTTRIQEVDCSRPEGLDDGKHCKAFGSAGAELSVRVNINTQQVMLDVTKPSYRRKGVEFLDGCKVVDDRYWECTNKYVARSGSRSTECTT